MSSRYFDSSEKKADEPKGSTGGKTKKDPVVIQPDISRKHRWRHQRVRGGRRKPTGSSDPYPGPAPIDPDALERQDRGPGVQTGRVRTKFQRKMQGRREKDKQMTMELAARTELLADDEGGFMEGDDVDEFTARVTQTQIKKAVDVESAAKGFDLNLQQFGPYKIDYTRNGRHLVLGGRRGHVAAFEWMSKKLMCEINVMESVHDVKWLHTENLFAVAQKKWTYIYDNQGIEIHCLKKLDNIVKLEFLPYHFLLASGSERGFLSWVDISIGKIVSQFNTRLGSCNIMCQNPWNAVLCLGHAKGIVTMWTPNTRDPVAKILAHRQPVRAVAVDRTGNYMATAAVDRSLKIWDVRNFQCLKDYRINAGASNLHFSGRGLLGVAMDNAVEIYKDACIKTVEHPYMTHKVFKTVSEIQFAPFEDAMGIGHAAGFTSILVPGSGEATFDALEVNPYQTKKQRRETEVKALLEKIKPELITLDPTKVSEVDFSSLEQKMLDKAKKPYLKPPAIDFEPRPKTKGKRGTAKRFHIKRTVIEEEKRRNLKKQLEEESATESKVGKPKQKKEPKPLLDRLK